MIYSLAGPWIGERGFMDYFCVASGKEKGINIDDLLDELKKLVPHIKWKLCWSESDIGSGVIKCYSYIGVPEYQQDEGEYIFTLWEDGEDLTNYRSESRFPHIFKVHNGEYQILPSINEFYKESNKLLELLTIIHENMTLKEWFQNVLEILNKLYMLYYKLPHSNDITRSSSSIGTFLPAELEDFNEYAYAVDPYNGQSAQKERLSETLESILNDLGPGLHLYEKFLDYNDPQYAAKAVNEWVISFDGIYGWGNVLLDAMKVIHSALYYIARKKRPEFQHSITPKDYLFAHCICSIPDVMDDEIIVVDYNKTRVFTELANFALNCEELVHEQYYERFNSAEYPDWYEDISADELNNVKTLLSVGDRILIDGKDPIDWPLDEMQCCIYDILWTIIKTRIEKQREFISKGEIGWDEIEKWIDPFNWIIEIGISDESRYGACLKIHLCDFDNFPKYIVDLLLAEIDYYDRNNMRSPLYPFKRLIENMGLSIMNGQWPSNDIEFGQLLAWVNIYNSLKQDDY